jgi:hypothetical protein
MSDDGLGLDPEDAALLRKMEAAANTLRTLPTRMADFYANGGDGVGQGVVGDRFQGQGNQRFAPLSPRYAKTKGKHSKELNKRQKEKYGKGSKLITVPFASKSGTEGIVNNSLPILVLSGDLRAAVTSRDHQIEQNGDTAIITFSNLPDYAKWHQTGTKKRAMPARSPVDPNDADMKRVNEFAQRHVDAAVGEGKFDTKFGGGTARIIQ